MIESSTFAYLLRKALRVGEAEKRPKEDYVDFHTSWGDFESPNFCLPESAERAIAEAKIQFLPCVQYLLDDEKYVPYWH